MKIEKTLGSKSSDPQYNILKKESDSDWLLNLEKIDDTEAIKIHGGIDMKFIGLQNMIQNDTRQFSLVFHIIQTKHDAAKNTLRRSLS